MYELGDRTEESKLPCTKSTTGQHDWKVPRMEDSIDKKRELPPVYCTLCFAVLKPFFVFPLGKVLR